MFTEYCVKFNKQRAEFPYFYDRFEEYKKYDPGLVIWGALTCFTVGAENRVAVRSMKHSVSTDGEIYSHSWDRNNSYLIDPEGYARTRAGNKYYFVHRCVLSTFCNDYPDINFNSFTVNHKDYHRSKNGLLNLEWMSRVENVLDGQEGPSGMVSDPIKIVVVTPKFGDPIGTTMTLLKRTDLRQFGISPRKFKNKFSTKSKLPAGCSITKDKTVTATNLTDNFIKFLQVKLPY